MDRSQSTSFQQVEDWLRGLGLLQYAQSFYDNGYEDVDTCKEINYEDLDVIGVKGQRDRDDIILAVQRLKQNVYFVLEAEPAEKLELIKFEPIILKSKLKEVLKSKNVQLIEPPYYSPDGTLGDLYPLAIILADELVTHFGDVLDGLEQLRKRQLPAQTYDQMNEMPGGEVDREGKRRSSTLLDPADYLNCEVKVDPKNRGYSFSKYDTRITKSTTDLTKGVHHERSSSVPTSQKYKINKKQPSKEDPKGGKSRFGSMFARKDTVKSKGSPKEPHYEFKADELSMSQTEICNMFSKIKKNEMSQEEVLAAVKKRTASGDGKQQHSPNTTLERPSEHSTSSLGKSKKGKINKTMIKRTPSSTFYTSKDDSTPYFIPPGENNNSLERTRSGSSIGGDDSLPDSTKSSPEVGKTGIISKIRSSMRKKGRNENEDSPQNSNSQSGSLSSQENIALSDTSGKNSPEVKRHETPPPVPPNKPVKPDNVYQHPIPVVPISKPAPTPPSKPRKSEGDWEVFQDEDSPSHSNDAPLKIKEYAKYQDETSRRRSQEHPQKHGQREGDLAPGRGMVLDLNKAKLKPVPKAPPRVTRTSASSQEDGSPSSTIESKNPSTPTTPRAPPRTKKNLNPGTPGTPVESIGIDDIGMKMDHLIAGLNDRLNDIDDNYIDDTQLDGMRKPSSERPPTLASPKPPSLGAKPLPSKRPMLPPRPGDNVSRKDSLNTNQKVFYQKDNVTSEVVDSNKKDLTVTTFRPLSLKRILWKKLRAEGVQIHETPYTIDGIWNVPYELIQRYAEELDKASEEIIQNVELLRVEECNKVRIPVIPYTEQNIHSHQLPEDFSLDQWLIYKGLPMFTGDLKEVQVTTIEEVNELKEKDFKLIGVYQENHVNLLKTASKRQLEKSSIVFC